MFGFLPLRVRSHRPHDRGRKRRIALQTVSDSVPYTKTKTNSAARRKRIVRSSASSPRGRLRPSCRRRPASRSACPSAYRWRVRRREEVSCQGNRFPQQRGAWASFLNVRKISDRRTVAHTNTTQAQRQRHKHTSHTCSAYRGILLVLLLVLVLVRILLRVLVRDAGVILLPLRKRVRDRFVAAKDHRRVRRRVALAAQRRFASVAVQRRGRLRAVSFTSTQSSEKIYYSNG